MRRIDFLTTTTFRLAASFVTAFAVLVAALGVGTYLITAGTLTRQLDARIRRDAVALEASYRSGGMPALVAAVAAHARVHPNGALEYAVTERGTKKVGGLATWPTTPGWSSMPYLERDSDLGRRRFLVSPLGGGVDLVVAADPEDIDEVEEAILDGFLSAFGAVVVLGVLGGAALSAALLRRVETIRRTAEAIIGGDLGRRIPVRGTGDDFDRLSQTLNRMLDRIAELMASLHDVSANIAHDLKTPLARLRQRLELARAGQPAGGTETLEVALGHVDEILATFEALLRIAQIESGTRRAGFATLDLSDVFTTVAEAFAPAAEDRGQRLTTAIAPGIQVVGDRELLTQMVANLVENAIRHTAPGARIQVALCREAAGVTGIVADDGPGIPAMERERIFHRFHRLERSRSVPGSGLGLSTVKAVADIHDATIEVGDADPGVRLTIRFRTDQLAIIRSRSDGSEDEA